MKKIMIKTILEKLHKLILWQKFDNRPLTYECGLEAAHTFVIDGDDKNEYINYVKNLAFQNGNNQFLKGIADGLEQKYARYT